MTTNVFQFIFLLFCALFCILIMPVLNFALPDYLTAHPTTQTAHFLT